MNNLMMRPRLVNIVDGSAFTTSLAVADGTENEHASVIKLIRSYLDDFDGFGRVRFEIEPFQTAGGTQTREVALLNEPQATLLLTYMRNTPVIRQFKRRLVHEFYELAHRQAQRPDAMTVLNDPAAMRGLLLNYTEKVLALESKVAEQAPQVSAFRRISDADGSLCLRDAAKNLQMRPIDLKKRLLIEGWIYSRPGHSGYIAYQDRIQSGGLVHKVHAYTDPATGTERISEQVRITPKGLAKLAQLLAGLYELRAA